VKVEMYGGPADGLRLDVPEPVRGEMVLPQLQWPIEFADEATVPLIKHHYVFDQQMRRFVYAGDWP
jgi:hypothetical protein